MIDIVGSSFIMAFKLLCDILRLGVLVVNVVDRSHDTAYQTLQPKIAVAVTFETFMK